MRAIIIKLVISVGLPSAMFALMGSSEPKYNIIANHQLGSILMFILIALVIYFACTMIAVFVKKTQLVILGFFAGAFVGGLIWLAVCVGLWLIFGSLGMGEEMFTDAHSENQCLVVAILDVLLLIPLGIDIIRTVRNKKAKGCP